MSLAGDFYTIFSGQRMPETLLACGMPIGIAPTGTMAANGAVTLGTVLDVIYESGLWLYFAGGAVYAGSAAGFYWVVMSLTTFGQVYDNIYVPGTNSFDAPASPTAVVDAGPGAFTGVTSEITTTSVVIPGGLLGPHGMLSGAKRVTHINSAGVKTVRSRFGGAQFASQTGTTTTDRRVSPRLTNAGAENRQYVNTTTGAIDAAVTTALSASTIDTAADTTFTDTITAAVATDWVIQQHSHMTVYPS